MATPLTPTVSISSDVSFTTCNCCGSQDATVRQLSFQWRDPGPHPLSGGSTVVSLCQSCRALTARALAADDESSDIVGQRVDPGYVGSLDEGSDRRLFVDRAPQVCACARCSGSGYLVRPYWLVPAPVPPHGAPPDSIWATTRGTAHIREATLEASELARRANRPVAFDFNDLLVVVRPHDDPEEVWRSWWLAKYGETPEQTAARR